MEEADLMDDNHGLLEKLRLYEGSYLKRAAALLFHPDPEKYVTGAFVKVGFFRESMDLVYQDEVHGNLFQQIVKLMDLLCTKYMKAIITYEGIQRIETLPMPREALREALLNACINNPCVREQIGNNKRWSITRRVDCRNIIVFTSKYAL